jgi:hypothetical protein
MPIDSIMGGILLDYYALQGLMDISQIIDMHMYLNAQ